MFRDDQSGFGLTLSGDRPVSVQTVRPGGSADRAGIREKDVIVKVNGTHVTQSTHTEVVELIACKRLTTLYFLKSNSFPWQTFFAKATTLCGSVLMKYSSIITAAKPWKKKQFLVAIRDGLSLEDYKTSSSKAASCTLGNKKGLTFKAD